MFQYYSYLETKKEDRDLDRLPVKMAIMFVLLVLDVKGTLQGNSMLVYPARKSYKWIVKVAKTKN